MVKQEVSSDMMVPKWRVLTPLLEVRVLEWDEKREIKRSSDREKKKTHFPCMGSQIHATGCPELFTALIWPGK